MTAVELPALTFAGGLPGFPAAHRFALVQVGEEDAFGIFRMRSLDDPELEFIVAAPVVFFPDYAPEIDDETAERLGLSSAADALLLVIVTIRDGTAATATANLFAPIVINQRTLAAAQVVLVGSPYSLQEPLLGADAP
jgi:flagellar assembly factor FliW